MTAYAHRRMVSAFKSLSKYASYVVISVALLVLGGWVFDILPLKSAFLGFATMKFNTAVAMVALGIALRLANEEHAPNLKRYAMSFCALIATLIGFLTLIEYIFSQDLGIDQLLVKDTLTPESSYPGRMSPVVAVSLYLLGIALLLLDQRPFQRMVDACTIIALLTSLLALIGYAYGIPALYRFFPFASIAIHTALIFSILCLGILFARPEQGLMQVFSSDSLGGLMARRFMPAAIVIPLLLGWLLLTGQRMGLYDSLSRLTLFALSNVIVFSILILWNASMLRHADLVRQQAQAELSQSEKREAAILNASLDGVISIDHEGRVLEFNPAAQKIFGYGRAEILGRKMSELIIPPSMREQHRTGLAKFLATGQGPVIGKRMELTGMRADGTEFPIELTITPITSSEQPIFTGFLRDITQRKQAEEELRKNAVRTQALADISSTLAAVHLDYQAVLDVTARHTTELIGDACSIRLISDDGQRLELASLYHPEPRTLGFLREILGTNPLRTDTGLVAQIIQTGRPMLIPTISPEQLKAVVHETAWPILEHISIHSMLVVPLRAQGGVLGTLTLTRDQPNDPYTGEDQALLQDLADRAALSIVNARLYTAMQRLNNELEQRVTERTAQLKESGEKFSKAFLASPAAVSIASLPDDRYINVNEALAKLTGYSREELLGRTAAELGLVDATARAQVLETIRTQGFAHNVEIQIHTKSNQIAEVLTSIEQMELGGQLCLLSVNFDITDRKRAEVELQKAKLDLEAANKELEAFSYSVSHDLRSPLRSIDGFSQALLEDYADQLPSEGRNYLERIRASAHRMAELIEDLLKLSHVTRAHLKFVPVDLTKLVRDILAELQRPHPERSVRWSVAPNLTGRGDPQLIQIVLENLLNNAWKYTSKQEQAEIEFGSKYEKGQIIYFVHDNGAGFDMAYAGKLFGAFQRFHTTMEFPGTGIGLATVQRIIHRHGGRVWAESAVGQGATFFFTLPAAHGAQPKTTPKEEDSIFQRAKEII
jgi:PAS domain S-box-containing protein